MSTDDTEHPDLPGYTFIRGIGTGGFADVYLYQQLRPTRDVAVKVLREATSSPEALAQFENEVNRMSALSSHPGILTIYEVGVSTDGRPFLTMEYCPGQNFAELARTTHITVPRALEVGIKISAAVETAHRAGILHRDIKPANILVTGYEEPALADFGIASGRDVDDATLSQGLTIPFAPPEALTGRPTDERADVYSLGATIYALLAARSPFSTGTGSAAQSELIRRILHDPVAPTGRRDVTPELERVLATAMTKDPGQRYDSAAAFGRALQTVEAALGLRATQLTIEGTRGAPKLRTEAEPDDEDSTRFRGPQVVNPQGPGLGRDNGGGSGLISGVPTQLPDDATRASRPTIDPAEFLPDSVDVDTVLPPLAKPDEPPPPRVDKTPSPKSSRTAILLTTAGAVALVAIAVLFIVTRDSSSGTSTSTTTEPDASALVLTATPSPPDAIEVSSIENGFITVTFEPMSPEEGDFYRVEITDGPLTGETFDTSEPEVRIETDEALCVLITTIRSGEASVASRETCSA